MKLPIVILLAGAAGLTVSVRAFQNAQAAEDVRKHTTYYANGQVETECDIRGERRDGTCKRYYADGSPLAEGAYVEGKMDGEWTFWRPDGSVDPERSGRYEAGVRVGA